MLNFIMPFFALPFVLSIFCSNEATQFRVNRTRTKSVQNKAIITKFEAHIRDVNPEVCNWNGNCSGRKGLHYPVLERQIELLRFDMSGMNASTPISLKSLMKVLMKQPLCEVPVGRFQENYDHFQHMKKLISYNLSHWRSIEHVYRTTIGKDFFQRLQYRLANIRDISTDQELFKTILECYNNLLAKVTNTTSSACFNTHQFWKKRFEFEAHLIRILKTLQSLKVKLNITSEQTIYRSIQILK